MNIVHHWLCRSDHWRDTLQARLPWALKDVPLGSNVLEIGPGYGVATQFIQPTVEHLTCVEIDPNLARALSSRMSGKNVTVLCEDAASMSLANNTFDAVVCFTMLHHVPSPALQDRLIAEAARVLRPGGVFAGTDSIYSWRFRLLHLFDTMVLISPAALPDRLKTAGFVDVHVEVQGRAFRFHATKPANAPAA